MDGRWINLKVPFRKFSGHMQTNLRGAVELLGLVWEGREHCGLDDARNTAYLALELVKKGIILKVTNSFKTYADDGSKLYIPKLRKPKAMPRPFKNAETNVEEVETTIDHNNLKVEVEEQELDLKVEYEYDEMDLFAYTRFMSLRSFFCIIGSNNF
jgi:transcriptional regulator NrdR family protein